MLKEEAPTELKLSGDSIGVEGLVALSSWVQQFCPALHTLKLDRCLLAARSSPLDPEQVMGVVRLGLALQQRPSVTSLDLSSNFLGPRCAKTLAINLEKTQVETLILEDNLVGDLGAKDFARMLYRSIGVGKKGCQVQELDLSCNKLGVEGLKALAHALTVNGTLTHLSIRDNNIATDGTDLSGIEDLSKALTPSESDPYNVTLKELNISGNVILNEGGEILADALASYPHGLENALTILDLHNCKADAITCSSLREISRPEIELILDFEGDEDEDDEKDDSLDDNEVVQQEESKYEKYENIDDHFDDDISEDIVEDIDFGSD